jgi:hypothetical protein
MKRFIILIALFSLPLLGLHDWSQAGGQPATAPVGVEVRGTKHILHMPEVPFELPAGPGKDVVTIYCGVCHTQRYILLQPPFSKETWANEVTKMRKNYSAPIPDEKVQEIVNYLVSVRGTGK